MATILRVCCIIPLRDHAADHLIIAVHARYATDWPKMRDFQVTVRRIVPAALALAFLATSGEAAADVCVYKPPRVRRVSGFVVDHQGVPIPGVTVAVLEQGTALSSVVTNDTGGFDFDVANPGKYEIDLSAAGFKPARYQLTLSRPTKTWKHALRIEMEAGAIHCEGDTIRVVAHPQSRR